MVLGAADALITSTYGEAWKGHIPQADMVVIPDAGHLVNLDQPDALAAAVAEFLTV